nr:asparagine synthase-related protein [Nanchangia anserum]
MRAVRGDRQAAAEFRHLGFVSGTDTLVEGIHGASAGQIITLSASGFRVDYTVDREAATPREESAERYFARFGRRIEEACGRVLELAGDRQLLVPLSGGADSRLLVALLRRLGAANVTTFTYGVAGSREVEISRRIAEGVGFTWHGVTIDPHQARRRWSEASTADFLRATWSGRALPHIQDWYALGELARTGVMEPGAIVLPGHTIVGVYHDSYDPTFSPTRRLSRRQLHAELAEHHYVLRSHPEYAELAARPREQIAAFLDRWWGDEDPRYRAFVVGAYNVVERQAKYINNSMRAYEHFGCEWALPMLDRDVVDEWMRVPVDLIDPSRAAYVRWANEVYSEVTGSSADYFGSRVSQAPASARSRVRAALAATGLLEAASRTYGQVVSLRHPMAFEALRGPLNQAQYARRIMSGVTTLGVFADLFVANRWVPGHAIVPED